MTRWEYMSVELLEGTWWAKRPESPTQREVIGGERLEVFNSLGENGWELVAFTGYPNQDIGVFKRPAS